MTVIGCLALLVGHNVQGEAGKVLPIAMENYPPFEFEQEGKIVGFTTEIVAQVLERLGYSPDIKNLPWSRAETMVKGGHIAAIYSLVKNSEREQYYYFSDPLCTVTNYFFKLKKNEIQWQSMDDLKDYSVGISQGYQYAPEFMQAIKGNLFKRVDKIAGNNLELRHLRRLKYGLVDLSICSLSVCQYLIKTHAPEFDMIDYIDNPVGNTRLYYIGFSKQWPGAEELVAQFNAELEKFVAEGKRAAIFEKYGVADPFKQSSIRSTE
ncbi:substrate-binding periplasmic protein [Halioxenophilus sp. WMMB6]|uniref:substrate-binding periplasmic protein n=1 Tax=Halioxenophilus sp. WMMB6 TaxID=3073815 RepID=UPI00295F4A34|nr:transporter substrate-binding domain-containing protein [Halioxenophilus sp. WMMB6]